MRNNVQKQPQRNHGAAERHKSGGSPTRPRNSARKHVAVCEAVSRPVEAEPGDQREYRHTAHTGDDLAETPYLGRKSMQENVDADMCVNGERVGERQIKQAGHQIQTDQVIGEREGPIDNVTHEYVGDDDQHNSEKTDDSDRRHNALDAGESGTPDHESLEDPRSRTA